MQHVAGVSSWASGWHWSWLRFNSCITSPALVSIQPIILFQKYDIRNWIWLVTSFCNVCYAQNTRTASIVLWTGLDSDCMYTCLIAITEIGTHPKMCASFLYTLQYLWQQIPYKTCATNEVYTLAHTHTTSPVYIAKWIRVMWSVLIQTMLYSMLTP